MKAIPIQTVLRQHSKAIHVSRELENACNRLKEGVMGTFVYIPELGNSPISCAYMLDAAAAHYEKQQAWAKDSPDRAAFRDLIERYRQPLADLLALKQEWRRASGLESLQSQQLTAMQTEAKAWREILARLRACKDTGAIAGYLAKNSAVIDPYEMKVAMRLIGKAGVK